MEPIHKVMMADIDYQIVEARKNASMHNQKAVTLEHLKEFSGLREWDGRRYTGRHICKRVTYLLSGGAFGVQEGFCVMGLGHTEDVFDGDYSQSDAGVERG